MSAARIAGCKDGSLYALNNDKGLYRNVSGGADGAWSKIGTAESAQDIICGGTQLWAFNTDRSLYRNDGTVTAPRWTKVGKPSGAKQISAGAIGNNVIGLYALNDNNTLWKSATGADGSWTQIGQPSSADRISGGAKDVWALNTDKRLFRGNGTDADWTFLDTPEVAKIIADDGSVSGGALWALNTNQELYHGIVNGGMEGEVCRPFCWGTTIQNITCDRCNAGLSCGDSKRCEQASAYGQPCLEVEIINPQPVCDAGLTCQGGECFGNGAENQPCRIDKACDNGLACTASGKCINVSKAMANCALNDRNCNACASDVPGQFTKIFAPNRGKIPEYWKFDYGQSYPPSNATGRDAFGLVNTIGEHVQSFVRTNDPVRQFAGLHSTDGRGILFILKQGTSDKRLESLHWTQTDHPAGMQAIGQFLVYADTNDLRVHDMANATVAQTRTLPVPSPGIGKGGDGIGATQLANGDTLIVAGPEKGADNPTAYRFFAVHGPLPTATQVSFLGEADSSRWKGYRGLSDSELDSDNLSVVNECNTGAIYIVNAVDGLWRLSRVTWSAGKPSVEPVNFANNDDSVSDCHLRSSGTVWTAGAGKMLFYCHERRVWNNGQGVESVDFAHYEPPGAPRTGQPPGSSCCTIENGVCTTWVTPPARCP